MASTQTVFASPPNDEEHSSWWTRYENALGTITATSLEVLRSDCRYILEKGILGSGAPGASTWPPAGVRRGLVVGSVQSGKTASMLGTVAMALDQEVDIVVLLAGTRVSLWQQTFDRMKDQLGSGQSDHDQQRSRILLPKAGPSDAGPIAGRYALAPVRIERALRRRQPIIVVALKHPTHLHALRSGLVKPLFAEAERLDRPVHMMVLDDEADDGSILDAAVENSLDPLTGTLKQIPRAIADLWAPPSVRRPENFYATYIGYTATPQANFLQQDQNPLSPEDFVVALRTPFDRGDVDKRTSTFNEPLGLRRFYTGGEAFYRRTASAALTRATDAGYTHSRLEDSVRAFLVAGAVKLYRSPDRTGPKSALSFTSDSADGIRGAIMAPHAMLFHPSQVTHDHFSSAVDILEFSGLSRDVALRDLLSGEGVYLSSKLIEDLRRTPNLWSYWLDSFEESWAALRHEFDVLEKRSFPSWNEVAALLEEELIPGTRVSVVNSDHAADDRPEYEPRQGPDGKWHSARDISTIFVAGNVMARGLTLEGLTTTFFTRSTESPLADTQMQMQRWFGYRGSYLEVCRVFAARDQLDLWNAYHDTDEAAKALILEAMTDDRTASPAVLQGHNFLATGKIANLGNVALHPGRKPFIRYTNSNTHDDPNADVLVDLFDAQPSHDVIVDGRLRGRALDRELSLLDAAEVLNALRFLAYDSTGETQLQELWRQIEVRVNAAAPLPPNVSLYNAPPSSPGGSMTEPRPLSPYRIPAYLKLWHYCETRHVRGLFVTGARNQPWAMVDLEQKSIASPSFTVGIRYGRPGSPAATGPFERLPFSVGVTQRLTENGIALNTWGSNNPLAGPGQYKGDEYFDYYARQETLPQAVIDTDGWRPAGSSGQILFYVNRNPDEVTTSISVGVCVPAGGPDQFSATVVEES